MKTHFFIAFTLSAILLAGQASAEVRNLGEIADGITGQLDSVNQFISVAAFVMGVAMAIAGLMKFRAHSQNPNDPSNKMSTAFILIFVGAGLVAIPSVLGSGVETIFGTGADTTNGTTGFTSL